MNRQNQRRPMRRGRTLLLALVAAAAVVLPVVIPHVLLRAPTPSPSSDVSLVGASDVVLARHEKFRMALGFPAGEGRQKRAYVGDDLERLDEVDEVDGSGRVLCSTRFDKEGRLRFAVRLDMPANSGAAVSKAEAVRSAKAAAKAVGFVVREPGRATQDPSNEGWVVSWDRYVDGVRARPDGTEVHLVADGRIESVLDVTHVLAPPPGARLSAGAAASLVESYLDQNVRAVLRGDFHVEAPILEWVAPNGAFDPSQPSDPQPTLRLAWVVNVRTTGTTAESVYLITYFVDAGDGGLLGGDVVE
jgi:hypothetical protein